LAKIALDKWTILHIFYFQQNNKTFAATENTPSVLNYNLHHLQLALHNIALCLRW